MLNLFKSVSLVFLSYFLTCNWQIKAQDEQSNFSNFEEKIAHLKQSAEQLTNEYLYKKSYDIVRKTLHKVFQLTTDPIRPISLRSGTTINPIEIEAIEQRKAKSSQAIKKLLSIKKQLEWTPTIGIVASGGGDRAMISTTGFLIGLEKTGLLETCSYFAALSGSTWAGCTWLARNVSPTKLKDFMRQHEVTDDVKLKHRNFDEIAKALLKKFTHDQYLSCCDLWGSFLADVFFEDLPREEQEIYLSQFAPLIKDGSYPFLICTAIHDYTSPYQWAEFSPIECGSCYLNSWIPTHAFGKEFTNGQTTDPAPELSVGFMMGMFGSAYAISMKELLRRITPKIQDSVIKTLTQKGVPSVFCEKFSESFFKKANSFFTAPEQKTAIDYLRLSPPKVYNFTRGTEKSPLIAKKHLTFVDAGLDFNLPFPPLLRRKIPLYFVCDASAGKAGNPLKKAENYARREGFKFPTIDIEQIQANKITLLYDENDPEVPVIVYVPNRIKFSTFKFEYTDEEFVKLSEYMEKVIIEEKETFIKAIKIALNNHKKLNPQTNGNYKKAKPALGKKPLTKKALKKKKKHTQRKAKR